MYKQQQVKCITLIGHLLVALNILAREQSVLETDVLEAEKNHQFEDLSQFNKDHIVLAGSAHLKNSSSFGERSHSSRMDNQWTSNRFTSIQDSQMNVTSLNSLYRGSIVTQIHQRNHVGPCSQLKVHTVDVFVSELDHGAREKAVLSHESQRLNKPPSITRRRDFSRMHHRKRVEEVGCFRKHSAWKLWDLAFMWMLHWCYIT